MPGGASGGRLTSLLQLAVVLVISIALVHGQTISFTGCPNYQSSPNFNAAYVAKLASVSDGYSMLLTSDRPRTSACQRIIFHSDGSLFISYQDDYNEMRNFTSNYTVHEATFTEAGHIMIDVPGGALGTGLSGNIKLHFIVAEDDYFVVATCESLILLPVTIELVHAFIPTSQLGMTPSESLNSTIAATGKLQNLESLREVKQECAASLRGVPNIYQIYHILVKLGILPPLPFRSDSGRISQFYSAVPSSVVYPGYPYPSVHGGPVRSIAYGTAPVQNQPIPRVSQTPPYIFNAPPATSGYPGFTYQTQGLNYVPVVPSKFQSPTENYDPSAFGSHQSGVTYISGVPYNIQTPGGANFDTSAFGSQHPGVRDMSGAPLTFQSSGISFDPSTLNFQPFGMNHDSSAFNIQSPEVSRDQSMFSAQSPGIRYDSSAFNIQSPEVSRDQSMFSAQSPGMSYDSSAFNIQSSVVSQDPSVFSSPSSGMSSEPSPFTPEY